MKIGFVCINFYPYRGGCEDITFNIARELVNLGHDVHVFTSDLQKKLPKKEIVKGIRIHRSKRFFRYRYYLDFTPGIIKDVLSHKLDILHVQSTGFMVNDTAVALKKLFSKTKIVNTPHGPFMALKNYPLWQDGLREMYRILEKPVNWMYDGVVEVNPYQWKWMVRDGFRFKNIKFLPNSIPKEMFKKVPSKDFVEKYNLKNKLVLSYIGRIQKYKGLDQVVKVLPDLVKKNKNVVFLMMGSDAGDTERLKRLAKKLDVEDNIRFTGFVSEDDKLKGLDVSDIFVFPSEWEAFGIVLLEAMARNNAVVSTKTEGGRYVVGKENGFLYDFEDTKELKKFLLKLISDKKLLNEIKANNLKKAKKYRCDKIVKGFEEFYLQILRKKR